MSGRFRNTIRILQSSITNERSSLHLPASATSLTELQFPLFQRLCSVSSGAHTDVFLNSPGNTIPAHAQPLRNTRRPPLSGRAAPCACPGEALLLHRMILHGMAPWADGAAAEPEGRIIAYFRPEFADVQDWLTQP